MHGDSISFIERNRQHVKVVLDVVMQFAKMEIPLRGAPGNSGSVKQGEFFGAIRVYIEVRNLKKTC